MTGADKISELFLYAGGKIVGVLPPVPVFEAGDGGGNAAVGEECASAVKKMRMDGAVIAVFFFAVPDMFAAFQTQRRFDVCKFRRAFRADKRVPWLDRLVAGRTAAGIEKRDGGVDCRPETWIHARMRGKM